MADEISKNTLLLLVVITLIVSLAGSFIVMDSLTKGNGDDAPQANNLGNPTVSGDVELNVKPPLSNNGVISVNIVKPK